MCIQRRCLYGKGYKFGVINAAGENSGAINTMKEGITALIFAQDEEVNCTSGSWQNYTYMMNFVKINSQLGKHRVFPIIFEPSQEVFERLKDFCDLMFENKIPSDNITRKRLTPTLSQPQSGIIMIWKRERQFLSQMDKHSLAMCLTIFFEDPPKISEHELEPLKTRFDNLARVNHNALFTEFVEPINFPQLKQIYKININSMTAIMRQQFPQNDLEEKSVHNYALMCAVAHDLINDLGLDKHFLKKLEDYSIQCLCKVESSLNEYRKKDYPQRISETINGFSQKEFMTRIAFLTEGCVGFSKDILGHTIPIAKQDTIYRKMGCEKKKVAYLSANSDTMWFCRSLNDQTSFGKWTRRVGYVISQSDMTEEIRESIMKQLGMIIPNKIIDPMSSFHDILNKHFTLGKSD
jgi:hypothetical protein